LTEEEAAALGDFNVQQNVHRFADVTLKGEQADAMIMDIDHQSFKYVWFTKPAALDPEADLQFAVGSSVEVEEGKTLQFAIDSYQHKTQKYGVDPLVIWVGGKDAVRQQLVNMCDVLTEIDGSDCPYKLVVNVEKMQSALMSSS
jgi:hypothetical protein